ncbi:hypothetical protein Lal_00030213 [Lupinus albus]|nr:hypothetical protein Lal_00030213 [Lupinus albus]
MASSSKRPRSSKSKQGESTSKSNPLNLTRLLANDTQRKVFEENFHGRVIFTPKYDNIGNFEFEDFLFPYLLRNKNFLTFAVKRTISTMSLFDDYDRKKFYLSICRISKEEIERRKQKSLDDNESNVAFRGSQSPLPYAIFITKILEHFSVPLEGGTKVALNLRESKVDTEVVHKIGFVIDLVTRRTYKHRTDRQPAPNDEPEPTAAPNQPESHAQSSASAVMPTSQMIMNELVSLRGYITTRMDVFDTQSQQIHYELHHISSRLSNMDADEDSSEPEY